MTEEPKTFSFIGRLRKIEMIARGRSVLVQDFLIEEYGGRSWRKMKGVAKVESDDGYIGDAEIHWFEAHGVGRVLWKLKRKLP